MTEGKGFCGRRQERMSRKKIASLIKNKEKIVVIPDLQPKFSRFPTNQGQKKG